MNVVMKTARTNLGGAASRYRRDSVSDARAFGDAGRITTAHAEFRPLVTGYSYSVDAIVRHALYR